MIETTKQTKEIKKNNNKVMQLNCEIPLGSEFEITYDIKPSVYSSKENKYLPYPKMRVENITYVPNVVFENKGSKYLLTSKRSIPYTNKNGEAKTFDVYDPASITQSGSFEFNDQTVEIKGKSKLINKDRKFYGSEKIVKNDGVNYTNLTKDGEWEVILTNKHLSILENSITLFEKYEDGNKTLLPHIVFAKLLLEKHQDGSLQNLFKHTKEVVKDGEYDAKGKLIVEEIETDHLRTSFGKFDPLNRLYETLTWLSRKESYPKAFEKFNEYKNIIKTHKEEDKEIKEEEILDDKFGEYKLLEGLFKKVSGWTYDSENKEFVDEVFVRIRVKDKLPGFLREDMSDKVGSLRKTIGDALLKKDENLTQYTKPSNIYVSFGVGLKRKIDKETGESQEGDNAHKLVFFAKFMVNNNNPKSIINQPRGEDSKELYEYVSIWDFTRFWQFRKRLLSKIYLLENNKGDIQFEEVKIISTGE